MNIRHNKMVKFIAQLHHVTQWRTMQHSEVSRYQLISQPKLDKFPLQCYSKCSKWLPLVSTQQCRHSQATASSKFYHCCFTWKHRRQPGNMC